MCSDLDSDGLLVSPKIRFAVVLIGGWRWRQRDEEVGTWSWVRVHRLRFLGIVVVDSRMARSAVFLVSVALAIVVAGLGTARRVGRRSSGVERDEAGALRDRAADRRDREALHRDQAGDHRDSVADHRDHDAEQRDHDAKLRDLDADLGEGTREPPGTQSDADAAHPHRGRSGLALGDAAAARTRASHDRGAGASERATALGHAAGDRMLREVAQALSSSLRPYDLVLRYGGGRVRVCAARHGDPGRGP